MYKSRTSFVIDYLNRCCLTSKKILDVGFIGGDPKQSTVHYSIVDNLKDSDSLVGIDHNESKMNIFLNNPKTRYFQERKNLKYETMSIFETAFKDNTFDYVLLLEVFEHLFSPYSVLKEIYRILKPGGSLIITYPNPLEIGKLVRYILQKDLLNIQYLDSMGGSGHKVLPHPVCFAIYLNAVGFHTKAIEFIKLNYTYPYRILIAILALFRLARKFSYYVGIIAQKSEKSAAKVGTFPEN